MDILIPGEGKPLIESLFSDIEDDVSGQAVIPDADPDKLAKVLAQMERGEMEYVILSDGDRFLQAAADARRGYLLEYNDGSDREQYRAANKKLSLDEITAAFIAYVNRDPSWQTQFTWEKFKL